MTTARPPGGYEGQPDVLTLTEAAAYLRISEKTLRDLIHRPESDPERVPCFCLGRQFRIHRRVLDAWCAERSGRPSLGVDSA